MTPPTPPSLVPDAANTTPLMRLQRRPELSQRTQFSVERSSAPEAPAEDATTTPAGAVSDRVIVVLGYREIGDDGSHGISAICRAAVRRAESLADKATPRAVIFTGWSSNGGPTEADQMAAEWNGRRDVALIREPRATNTAENAVRSLELLQAITRGSEVIAVCSMYHLPRVRYFFDRLYKRSGYSIGYRYVASPIPSLRLVLAELSSITRMARDRRHALRSLNPDEHGACFHDRKQRPTEPPALAGTAGPTAPTPGPRDATRPAEPTQRRPLTRRAVKAPAAGPPASGRTAS
jgi:uncharacterized SAM-binding protein YcdF (DUF218 family)